MFRRLFRLLLTLAIVGAVIWFLAPRIFDGAANSLLNSSVSQAQGLAQFIPANVNAANNSKGELQINLTGLSPETTYQLTLDEAQCGGSSTDLGSATSDANGNFYMEIPLTSLDTKQSWYVDVLQQGQSVACGLLQTDQDIGTQVINAAQSGPDVFGPQPTQATTPITNSSAGNVSSQLPNLPGTGASPGDGQQYDNNQYPRKY